MTNNITLRRAARLRSALDARVGELKKQLKMTTVDLNVFDPNPVDQVKAAVNTLEATYGRFVMLNAFMYQLRALIGIANATHNVNELLGMIAMHENRLYVIRQLRHAAPQLTTDQLLARLGGQRGDSATIYNHNMSVSIVTPIALATLEIEEKKYRLEIVKISDNLESINSSVVVPLTDAMVSQFTAEGLL